MEQVLKNRELEDKVNNITLMLEKLLAKENNKTEVTTEVKKEQENKGFQVYANIDPTKRVLLMNMMNAGGTFITHNNKQIRFNHFGHIQPARFEDIESLVTKYRDYFENLEIRILNDNEVVEALYLKSFYDKYDISKEEIENIINLDKERIVEKIKSLSSALQESVLSLIISSVAKNDSKYMDKNKWEVINNAFGIDIQEFANKYLVI